MGELTLPSQCRHVQYRGKNKPIFGRQTSGPEDDSARHVRYMVEAYHVLPRNQNSKLVTKALSTERSCLEQLYLLGGIPSSFPPTFNRAAHASAVDLWCVRRSER